VNEVRVLPAPSGRVLKYEEAKEPPEAIDWRALSARRCTRMSRRLLLVSIVVLSTLIVTMPASARQEKATPSYGREKTNARSPVIIFFDDMEAGTNGWSHVDNTALATPKWHLDTYHAYDGTYSWWCGELNPAFTGGDGYGNSWNQLLNIPETDIGAATYPILDFAYRCDSEVACDFTYVEAESGGVYVKLNRGFNGVVAWTTFPGAAIGPGTYDNPFNGRFRFVSDSGWSDEDGLYDSDGGGIQVDNVKIYDYFGGTIYFYDDCEGGGLCVPSVPSAAGDYWHQIDRECPAYSDPHSWWCGDDADTSLIPPSLNNSLLSPLIDVTGVTVCTLRFLLHAEVPTVDNDYWLEDVSTDGGATWYMVGNYWGDFAQCDGWATHGLNGIDIGPYLPGTSFQFKLTFVTTDNGCGPGVAGGAGITLDDTWVEDWTGSPVERTTWTKIKSLYR
jgi:hypothetical protein